MVDLYFINKQVPVVQKQNLEKVIVTTSLQKGGVPAAPSGTATLLRLSPSHQSCPRSLLYGHELQALPTPMA